MSTRRRNRWPHGVILVCDLVFVLGCAERDATSRQPPQAPVDSAAAARRAMPTRPIEMVQEAHTPELLAIPGVTGTFIGATADGKPCIKIMVVERKPELERKLPRMLEGYPVEIVESGHIRPLGDER